MRETAHQLYVRAAHDVVLVDYYGDSTVQFFPAHTVEEAHPLLNRYRAVRFIPKDDADIIRLVEYIIGAREAGLGRTTWIGLDEVDKYQEADAVIAVITKAQRWGIHSAIASQRVPMVDRVLGANCNAGHVFFHLGLDMGIPHDYYRIEWPPEVEAWIVRPYHAAYTDFRGWWLIDSEYNVRQVQEEEHGESATPPQPPEPESPETDEGSPGDSKAESND